MKYYYPNDSDVRKDTELQEWIGEIFTHAVLKNKKSGIITTIIIIVTQETIYTICIV